MLARYEGEKLFHSVSGNLVLNQFNLDLANRSYGLVVVFVFGPLLFVVLSCHLKNHEPSVRLPKLFADRLFQIWDSGVPIVLPSQGFSESMRLALVDLNWGQMVEPRPRV